MQDGLSGRKALVVGAHGGIGGAVAVALARAGIRCALMGRRPERLRGTADACAQAGTPAVPIQCDIADPMAVADRVREAIGALGGLNFLINCAGVTTRAGADTCDLERWDQALDVNVKATYHLARHALPEINRRPGGAIIKIGSVPALSPGAGAFLAATRGLDGYSEALFEDVREHGTKVCVIRPGYVNTPIVDTAHVDPARMIQPEDIARTVLFVLTMPETACPTEITIRPQRSPYR